MQQFCFEGCTVSNALVYPVQSPLDLISPRFAIGTDLNMIESKAEGQINYIVLIRFCTSL